MKTVISIQSVHKTTKFSHSPQKISWILTYLLTLMIIFTYSSGSKPGVRTPPGVRDKSLGVRQIRILIENVLKCLITIHLGVCEFSFFMLGGTRSEKGLEPLGLFHSLILNICAILQKGKMGQIIYPCFSLVNARRRWNNNKLF